MVLDVWYWLGWTAGCQIPYFYQSIKKSSWKRRNQHICMWIFADLHVNYSVSDSLKCKFFPPCPCTKKKLPCRRSKVKTTYGKSFQNKCGRHDNPPVCNNYHLNGAIRHPVASDIVMCNQSVTGQDDSQTEILYDELWAKVCETFHLLCLISCCMLHITVYKY